jgi:hypothetical protein
VFASWEQLINDGQYSQLNAGVALTNSTSLTDVSPGGNTSGQALLIPGSSLYPGLQLSVRARGIASTSGTPQLTLGLYFGGIAGVALAASTFTTSAGLANNTWSLSADLRVEAVGGSGSFRTLGSVSGLSSSLVMLPQTSSTGGQSPNINTGNNNLLTLGAQWGTAAAGNTLTVYQWIVEQQN